MKFSILIPVYNTEKYIEECLESILNQSYQNFQIVLVDDGSTDSSGKICDRYQNEYPQIVKVIHQKNQGQLASRCDAIKEADGDYCVFMDADDLIVENALEVLNLNLQKFDSPDMLIYPFYYDKQGILEKSNLLCKETTAFKANDIKRLREQFFSTILLNSMCTKTVRTGILKDSTFEIDDFLSLRCSEDRLQSMWILDRINNAVFINEPLYKYRLHTGSTTRQYSYKNIDRFNNVILYNEELSFAKKWGLVSDAFINSFNVSYVRHILYVFDLFYMNVSETERKHVIQYSWDGFLPNDFDVTLVENNIHINKKLKKLFYLIINKSSFGIKIYYLKKNLYKKMRKIKRKLWS